MLNFQVLARRYVAGKLELLPVFNIMADGAEVAISNARAILGFHNGVVSGEITDGVSVWNLETGTERPVTG